MSIKAMNHEKYCPVCQGVGQVDTGINESPVTVCNTCNGTGLKAQPEQEPVAWMDSDGNVSDNNDHKCFPIPLYTSPPQRCPNCDSLERQNAELDLRLAEQDQPPFGYLTNKRQRVSFEPNATGLSNMPMTIDWKIPVYGSPQPQPQRQLVGLTDEELFECEQLAHIRHKRHMSSVRGQQISPADDFLWHYARAIEAKLKEKNT